MIRKTYALEGVQARKVSLLPSGKKEWVVREIPSLDAILVSSAQCNKVVTDRLLQFSQCAALPGRGFHELGDGAYADVYGDGEHAYKIFRSISWCSKIGSFAANVGVQHGLSITPTEDRTWGNQAIVKGAEMSAGLIPNSSGSPYVPVWAMKQELGIADHKFLKNVLPSYNTQHELFQRAVRFSGLDPLSFNFDLHSGNYLYDQDANVLTKIDTMYNDDYALS